MNTVTTRNNCDDCGFENFDHDYKCYHADCDEDDYELHGCGEAPEIEHTDILQSTEGPWTVRTEANWHFVDSANQCIAEDIEDIANARLIAASPDLLEICKTIAAMGLIHGIVETGLLAAIAKAEGEV